MILHLSSSCNFLSNISRFQVIRDAAKVCYFAAVFIRKVISVYKHLASVKLNFRSNYYKGKRRGRKRYYIQKHSNEAVHLIHQVYSIDFHSQLRFDYKTSGRAAIAT